MIISAYRSFFLFLAGFLGEGWAIVALSCICSALMAPLMKAVAGVVRREAAYQEVILPQIARIKETFPGDMERNLHIQRLYRRYGYSPLSAVKKVLPLFVQIPFLLLTYYMLKGTAELNGVQFLFLKNLGKPDALLSGINLLPFVMTGVNLLTVAATPGFTKRDQTQAVGISLLFLVLLYTAPSALLLYWTLNNVITMVRTLVGQRCRGARLLASRVRSIPAGALNEIRAFRGPVLLRALAGFIGLLLLVLFPISYFLLAIVPKDIRMEVVSQAPISVRVSENSGGANGGFSVPLNVVRDFSSEQLYREFLPPDLNVRMLSCSFDCSALNRIEIKRIRLMVADLLAFDLSADDLCRGYIPSEGVRIAEGPDGTIVIDLKDGSGTFRPSADVSKMWKWAGFCPTGLILPRWIVKAMIGGLVCLLALSLLAARMLQKVPLNERFIVDSLALAFLASAFFTIMLPLQSFWANSGDYAFSVVRLLLSQIPKVILCGIVLFFVFYLVSWAWGYWFHVVILAVLVYEYIQTGVLSMGAPTMNGDMAYYANHALAMRDLSVLGIVVVLFMFFHEFIQKRFGKVVVVLVGVFALTLFSSLRITSGQAIERPVGAGYCAKLAVLENLQFTRRNVFVLVLDSVSTEVASDVLRNNPEIASYFPGFTVFENNIGMHHLTPYATTGTLTGRYYTNRIDVASQEEYFNSVFGEESALKHYADAGCPVYFLPKSNGFGYMANVGEVDCALGDVGAEMVTSPILWKKNDALSFSLRDLTIFRCMPFIAKPAVFKLLYAGSSGHGRVEDEETAYPIMRNAPSIDSEKTTFAFVHLHGAHAPHDVMRDGRKRTTDAVFDGYEQYYDQAYHVLHQTGRLFDSWRKSGVYDSSYIVLIADHGSGGLNDTRHPSHSEHSLPPSARPMMLLKPFSSDLGLCYNSTSSTHHARLREFFDVLRTRDLSISDSVMLLTNTNRVFVVPGANFVRRWSVDGYGSIIGYEQ